MEEVQVVIGIPGKWKDRTDLVQAVASRSEGFLMAGYFIHDLKKDTGLQVEVYDHDPDLKEAFSHASKDIFEDKLLAELEQHTMTMYVIAEVSDFEGLKGVVEVGAALLKAGGLAVKIETSGIAHTKEDWYELVENLKYFPIYSHFVTLIGDDESYYSCGMKAFGLPDVVHPSSISPEEATELLNNFNLYNIVEKPSLKNGDTFSLGENSTIYKLQALKEFRCKEDDIFFNQFGLFELVPA